ncbi:hypothetical protein AMS68_007897 [Peltaster fructicola]|uniref:Uncharacterized protein n=1 Tax=Peltaster fructicola TaxID=286661 RepID=A0A6H0Y6Z7_9PEZI|nr:hypothetical protein AMS68_007897 [Peltaster fructicola]
MFLWQTQHEMDRLAAFAAYTPDDDDKRRFDASSDLQANAENNIRARWIAQGIWNEDWGQAWAQGSKRLSAAWCRETGRHQGPCPVGDWNRKATKNDQAVWQRLTSMAQKSSPVFRRVILANKQKVTDSSRPYKQFCWQVGFLHAFVENGFRDIEESWQRTEALWREEGIWQEKWLSVPGDTWAYEQLEQEQDRSIAKPKVRAGGLVTQPLPPKSLPVIETPRRSRRLLAQQQPVLRRSKRIAKRLSARTQS